MEDKLSYANMLEIPVETCTIKNSTFTRKKAKPKKINHEAVKEELLSKINSFEEENIEQPVVDQEQDLSSIAHQESNVTIRSKIFKKPFKLSVISAQLMIIGALIVTILITNSVYPNSGLNVFMRGIFGNSSEQVVDQREYQEFSPVLNSDGEVSLKDGVMTITGEGSVYSTVSGKVTSVEKQADGTYTLTIEHSQKFSSVLTGLDMVYVNEGEQVYNTIPVGYVDDSVSMCFKNQDGEIIDDYRVVEDSVVWVE